MVDKNLFMETLHAVQEIARTSETPMDKEMALSYFKDMELSPEQEELVYQFLMLPEENAEEAGEERGGADDTGEEWDSQESAAAAKEQAAGDNLAAGAQAAHSQHFQRYLDEINGIAEMEADSEEGLYRSLLSGDTSVIEDITTQWLKRVAAIAGEYQGRGIPMDDLVQEGNMGLLLGLNVLARDQQEGGSPKRSAADVGKLLSGAVRESIEQYLGEESGKNQQGEAVLAKVSLVHQSRELLRKEKGELPSLRELSEYTKIPADEISDILSLVKDLP